jgi:hypothetical protein
VRTLSEFRMIGAPLVASWIAHVAFWVLLAMAARAARWRTVAAIGALWVAGYIASSQIAALSLFFMSYVAVLDIALVFIVLQRDIRFG